MKKMLSSLIILTSFGLSTGGFAMDSDVCYVTVHANPQEQAPEPYDAVAFNFQSLDTGAMSGIVVKAGTSQSLKMKCGSYKASATPQLDAIPNINMVKASPYPVGSYCLKTDDSILTLEANEYSTPLTFPWNYLHCP